LNETCEEYYTNTCSHFIEEPCDLWGEREII